MAIKNTCSAKIARKPVRSTDKRTNLRLDRETDERLRYNASDLGLTVTEYLAALIHGQKTVARPAAEGQCLALVGNRVVRALALLAEETVVVGEVVSLLRQAQRISYEYTVNLVPAYEAAVRAQGKDEAWGEIAESE
jgi:hypothetical protein